MSGPTPPSSNGDAATKTAEVAAADATTPFSLSQLWQQISLSDHSKITSAETVAPEDPKPKEKIVVLGREYEVDGITDEVEADIYSKIWLTYRAGFEPIPKSEDGPQPLAFIHSMLFNKNPLASGIGNFRSLFNNDEFTTDVGWGCMIRTSQSLLANTYQMLLLGRQFRFQDSETNELHNLVIDLFRDDYKNPFSLHNFIRVASELPLQVKPGQWFGPNAASLSIKRLCDQIDLAQFPKVPKLLVLISESSDLYEDEILKMFEGGNALLVLLPVRLGIDKINKLYHPSLVKLLLLKQSVGIAGGKPSSSFYFFGCREQDELLYLDPHFPQAINDEYGSFHTKGYQKLNINDLDPSMLIGLLLKDPQDYEELKKSLVEGPSKIIHFHDKNGLVRTASSSRPSTAQRRKNSEFVNVDGREEFTIIDDKKEEDFVDVGDELDDQDLQSYENSQQGSQVLDKEVETSNASVSETKQNDDFVHVSE